MQHTTHVILACQVMGVGRAKAAESPLPTGRLLTYQDVGPVLKGRQAEVRALPSHIGLHFVQLCIP